MSNGREPRVSRQLLASVRLRVTALATLAVIVVLVVAGIALVAAQRRQLIDRLDEAVRQRAVEVAVDLHSGITPGSFAGPGDDMVAQVVGADGKVRASSRALTGRPAVSTAPGESGMRTVHNVPLQTH